jgi:hypothetical protein
MWVLLSAPRVEEGSIALPHMVLVRRAGRRGISPRPTSRNGFKILLSDLFIVQLRMLPSSMHGCNAIWAAQNAWQLSCCQRHDDIRVEWVELPGSVNGRTVSHPRRRAIFCVHLVKGTWRGELRAPHRRCPDTIVIGAIGFEFEGSPVTSHQSGNELVPKGQSYHGDHIGATGRSYNVTM